MFSRIPSLSLSALSLGPLALLAMPGLSAEAKHSSPPKSQQASSISTTDYSDFDDLRAASIPGNFESLPSLARYALHPDCHVRRSSLAGILAVVHPGALLLEDESILFDQNAQGFDSFHSSPQAQEAFNILIHALF